MRRAAVERALLLGAGRPLEYVAQAARKSGARALVLRVRKAPDGELRDVMLYIASKAPKSTALWFGGATAGSACRL